jgi:hypothetical protein
MVPKPAPTDRRPDQGYQRGSSLHLFAIICSYSWPCQAALRIVECESRFDPTAVSWDGQDFGLFQIRAGVWRWWLDERGFDFWGTWMNAEDNTAMAYAIWAEYGWQPWSCY